MSFAFESTVPADPQAIFEYFSRPGALMRLFPPFTAGTIHSESPSLRDGRAVLGVGAINSLLPVSLPNKLANGFRLVSEHRRTDALEKFDFHDRIHASSQFPLSAVQWDHQHSLREAAPGQTRVIDTIATKVPVSFMRPTFHYRHQHLRDDIGRGQEITKLSSSVKVIAVTGASGFIGSVVTSFLTTAGYTVIRLQRHEQQDNSVSVSTGDQLQTRYWNPIEPKRGLLEGVDAVIHLAGENIFGRFNAEHKEKIYDSRVLPTMLLAQRAEEELNDGGVFVSGSAMGYYGHDGGDTWINERHDQGEGFLAKLTGDWEESALSTKKSSRVRRVCIRTGLVLGARGGTLQLMRIPYFLNLGGKIGHGQQWMSWISVDDIADIFVRAVFDEQLVGPINAAAPTPVRNKDFSQILATVLGRFAPFRIPAALFSGLLSKEGAQATALASLRLDCEKLQNVGFRFRFPELESALRFELGKYVCSALQER